MPLRVVTKLMRDIYMSHHDNSSGVSVAKTLVTKTASTVFRQMAVKLGTLYTVKAKIH